VPYLELLLDRDGKEAEKEMLAALQQSGIHKICYAHKSRVKSEDKLVDKLKRKETEKPGYQLQDITDVIGVRFVTLFRAEMPLIFEEIVNIINHTSELSPNPFIQGRLEEVIIYYTNPHDTIRYLIKDIVLKNSFDVAVQEKCSKEEYSSIHLVTRLNKKVDAMSTDADYFIPVEIQIRTVFEDAWGEIDHKYGYIIRTGKETGVPVSNPDSVLRHLKVLKQFTDACAEYADVIHMEAAPNQDEVKDTSRIVSVAPDDEVIQLFCELDIDNAHISTYLEAREQRLKAEAAQLSERGKGLNLLVRAAETFRELSIDYESAEPTPSNRKEYLFYYYVKMNEALCLLKTNQVKFVSVAFKIYESLQRFFPDFPLLKMRFGQANGKLGFTDIALLLFREAYKEIDEFEESGGVCCDRMPKPDYEHIKIHLPKILGYYLWIKCESLGNKTEYINDKLALLLHAPHLLVLQNNLLYYAVKIHKLASLSDQLEIYNYAEHIQQHLKFVENNCDIEKCEDIDTLDTLLKAYDILEQCDNVLKIIHRMVPMAEKALSGSPCDKDVMLQIEKEAIELKLKYGC